MDADTFDAEATEEAQGIDPQAFIAFALDADNIVDELDESKLAEIAQDVLADYQIDKSSMSDWFERMEAGLELAQLVKEDKTYPFEGAANIKYPLVTSAALQFNARAYPAVVPSGDVVKARVWGADADGVKAARAARVSEHMSFQLTGPVEEWEEETDKLLVQLPIVGTMVRKWWYDPAQKRPCCRLLTPGKFIVNDKVRNVNLAPRCSEELPLYPNEITERIRAGLFVAFDWTKDSEDDDAPQEFIEQHTRIDLDEDGYAEPYVVTLHIDTQTVVRIVADFREDDVQFATETEVVPAQVLGFDTMGAPVMSAPQEVERVTGIESIKRGSYFVAFHFLPSMDGGFHGTGLGLLLGDISKSINSIINMMLDAGKFSVMGGGFLGSEFRMKGGAARFKPGEWKPLSTSGADIRSGVVPLPIGGADATLFQLLGLLIDAGREISSVQDVVTGETPTQTQTATTTLALIEQGLMVFSASFKRIFRALKSEFGLLARINAQTVTPEAYAQFHDMAGHNGGPPLEGPPQPPEPPVNPQADYDLADMDIQPVADPASVTKMQKAAKAQLVMELVTMGLVDPGEALARVTEAMDIEDVEKLAPKPDPLAEPMAALQLQAAQAELSEKMAKIELTLMQVDEIRAGIEVDMAGVRNDGEKLVLEQKKLKMEGLFALLEDDRTRLIEVLRSSGRMAGKPGDGQAAQGASQAGGAAQSRALGALLGGQPGA